MYSLPYMKEPRWAKYGQKASLLLRYLAIAILGLVVIIGYSQPLELPGYVLIAGGISGIGGVITGYYRFEWVALGPVISALLIALIIFAPVSDGAVIMLIIALAFAMFDRLIHLTAVADNLRKRRKAEIRTEEMSVVQTPKAV